MEAVANPVALVVDDSSVMRFVGVTMFQKLGIVAVSAGNGREAVELAGTTDFGIILMDCQMQEMDGLEATMLIRQREQSTNRHALIVAVTAAAMRGECLSAGMDDFIRKPMSLDSLSETLKRWGLQQISSRAELKKVREALEQRRRELAFQTDKLAAQYVRLEAALRQTRADLTELREKGTSLSEFEAALVCRESAFKAQERYLNSRELELSRQETNEFGT